MIAIMHGISAFSAYWRGMAADYFSHHSGDIPQNGSYRAQDTTSCSYIAVMRSSLTARVNVKMGLFEDHHCWRQYAHRAMKNY